MKHLDVVDGVIGAIPLEERPASGVIGDNIELLILHLRMGRGMGSPIPCPEQGEVDP